MSCYNNIDRRLAREGDHKEALRYYPKRLGYEQALLNRLVERPGDFGGALKALPQRLGWMFVHAYQSYLFNKALSRCLREGWTVERLPLVGLLRLPSLRMVAG